MGTRQHVDAERPVHEGRPAPGAQRQHLTSGIQVTTGATVITHRATRRGSWRTRRGCEPRPCTTPSGTPSDSAATRREPLGNCCSIHLSYGGVPTSVAGTRLDRQRAHSNTAHPLPWMGSGGGVLTHSDDLTCPCQEKPGEQPGSRPRTLGPRGVVLHQKTW